MNPRTNLDPSVLLADIDSRLPARPDPGPVVAYWFQVSGSRTDYAAALREAADRRVVPLVVSSGFQNLNTLMTDLRSLLIDNRSAIEALPPPAPDKPMVLVLLSHTEFGTNGVVSPTVLPDWFPGIGGREALVWVEDLTWRVEISANDPLVRAGELRRLLLALDRTLAHRLRDSSEAGHPGEPLPDLTRRLVGQGSARTLAGLLSEADAVFRSVSEEDEYRLDLKNPSTPLAVLAQLVSKTPSREVFKVAGELGRMIALPESVRHRESLAAVLAGYTTENKSLTSRDRCCWNLLLTVYAAHRLSVVSAHAAEFARYPAPLLRSVAFDLRSALADTAELIRNLPKPSTIGPT